MGQTLRPSTLIPRGFEEGFPFSAGQPFSLAVSVTKTINIIQLPLLRAFYDTIDTQ